MIGMDEVASEIDSLIKLQVYNQQRKAEGLTPQTTTNHLVLSGNPGTGKSTVAEEIAKLYNGLGILPTDKVAKTDAGQLIGQYVNQIEQNVTAEFKKAKGGVMFVDEAYQLADSQEGRRAATQLMKLMEENKDDTVLIVAGYPGEMDRFLKINPGFPSRFARTINFPDYTPKENAQILTKYMNDEQDYATKDAAKLMMGGVKVLTTRGQNAREMRKFHDKLKFARASRLAGQPANKRALQEFNGDDVKIALSSMGVVPAGSGKLVKQK
ncbi:CbbX [uncultured Caudovirales phage]|uniref:CbbX n=1 Tax=uncultured Caudovirales phage TaxID=2100421 RepID=A0A6J5RAG0_9CAUD|nr:CbbX [uncultured Caudovirales phage]